MSDIKGTNGGVFHERKIDMRTHRVKKDNLGLSKEALDQFIFDMGEEFKKAMWQACTKGIMPRAVFLEGNMTVEGPYDEGVKQTFANPKAGAIWSEHNEGDPNAGT